MRSLKYLSGIIFIFFLLLISCNSTLAIGVQPLTFDFELSPGDTEEFSIIFSSSGIEERVNVSIYQSFQDYTGNLSYRKGDIESFPEMGWVTLESNSVIVPDDEDIELKANLRIPFGTRGGSYPIILMVEPEPSKPDDGVSLRVRYAVRLMVRIDGPALRERARINSLDLQQDEKGDQIVVAQVQNMSQLDYMAGVEVTIRDGDRKLIERLRLRSISAQKNMRDLTRLYPGSEVLFVGRPENYLFPGDYELRALMDYGQRGKESSAKNISILPGQFKEPDQDYNKFYSIEPERIISRLDQGKRNTESVEIRNISNESIYLKTEIKEVVPEYEHSLLSWLNFYNGENLIKLQPRQLNRFLKVIQLPFDVETGGYYSLLNIKAYQDETMLNLLNERVVPIICIVGSESNVEVETSDFQVINENGEFAFKINLINSASMHIEPVIELSLFNQEDLLIEKIELVSEDLLDGLLLPDTTGYYQGILNSYPEKGNYSVAVEIFNTGNSIDKISYSIEVK